ncbi:MAG: tRNA pseudouridine(38-40) synthase TruA [Candidatus Hadarchaeales archaeon]
MRFAMRLAYDGAGYFGYVRQPEKNTVESVFLRALGECAGVDPRSCRYAVATRTDRGVSALGQTVAVDLKREITEMELNSRLPEDVVVLSVIDVRDEFNPRFNAVEKHYRYVHRIPPDFDVQEARKVAGIFEGRHDFAAFCRREPGRSTVSEVKRVMVRRTGSLLVMDFFSRSFLWQQVRRMSGAIIGAGCGRAGEGTVRDLLENPEGKGFPPADPEGLFLVDIRYRGLRFRPEESARRRFLHHLEGCGRDVCRVMADMLKNRF